MIIKRGLRRCLNQGRRCKGPDRTPFNYQVKSPFSALSRRGSPRGSRAREVILRNSAADIKFDSLRRMTANRIQIDRNIGNQPIGRACRSAQRTPAAPQAPRKSLKPPQDSSLLRRRGNGSGQSSRTLLEK